MLEDARAVQAGYAWSAAAVDDNDAADMDGVASQLTRTYSNTRAEDLLEVVARVRARANSF